MADDTVDQLLQFIGFTLSRDDAAHLLRISSNNLETAVNKFYDADGNPSKIRTLLSQASTTWDETAFGGDRYGQPDDAGGGLPTFNIEYAPGVDNYPHSGIQSGAPSRPPSRTSQRSGVSAHHGDVPQQSIENSQESGVIGSSKPVFGPATKDYYDANSWALVPSTTSTEYIPDPIPSRRQREQGEPAFLKPLPNNDYLPALVAILHSIPQFRNALLAPEISQRSYWMGTEWWKGNVSAPARTVDNTSDVDAAQGIELIQEAQRLMAFLDTTDRAYASISPMLQLDAWKEAQILPDKPDDALLKFLLLWSSAYQKHTSQQQLNGVLQSVFNAGGQNLESFVLDASVVRQDPNADLTLYDILDQELFSTPAGNAHIVDISNVIILRLAAARTDAGRLDCKIPATFYADRYLEKNKTAIDDMFLEMKQYEDQLKEIDVKGQKLKYHTSNKPGQTQPLDSLQLIKTSMRAFEPREGTFIEDPKDADIFSQLQSVYNNIERKLHILDEQRSKVRNTLDSISSRFKAPIDDGTELMDTADDEAAQKQGTQHELTHPYKLVGVATRPGVLYLLHPDIKSDVLGAKQWWSIEYSTATPDTCIFKERVALSQVLSSASTDHSSALLVYANDAALTEPPLPLSASLQDFVKRDNLNFLEELQQSTDTDGLPTYNSGYDDAWASISAKAYHESNANSGISSATLTPNTEVGDEGVGMEEMVEVNGGMNAWAGNTHSNASSDTVGGEPMDIVDSQRSQATVNFRDVEMSDTEGGESREEPRVQHIEILERKGG